jgi:hypothetical protein
MVGLPLRRSIKKVIVNTGVSNVSGIQFTLSAEVAKAMRIVRRHFRILTSRSSSKLQYETTRYEGWWEFGAVAVRNAIRLENNIAFGGEISIGSGYLSEKPWALVGNLDPREKSEYKFSCFPELIEHYEKEIKNHYRMEFDVPFIDDSLGLFKLAERNQESIDDMFSMCILLTRDLIFHAGPDNDNFYDLFTNDSKDTSDSADVDEWESQRCKVFGRFGTVKSKDTYCPQANNHSRNVFVSDYYGCDDDDYYYQQYHLNHAMRGSCYQTVPHVKKKPVFKKCEPALSLISHNAPIFEGVPIHGSDV